MRMIFWIVVSFFLLLTVYRRIIEPFLEGYRNRSKPYNPLIRKKKKRQSMIDKSSVEDAEFKDVTGHDE
jgi:hypothetical protein